jgi:hypothetical protein
MIERIFSTYAQLVKNLTSAIGTWKLICSIATSHSRGESTQSPSGQPLPLAIHSVALLFYTARAFDHKNRTSRVFFSPLAVGLRCLRKASWRAREESRSAVQTGDLGPLIRLKSSCWSTPRSARRRGRLFLFIPCALLSLPLDLTSGERRNAAWNFRELDSELRRGIGETLRAGKTTTTKTTGCELVLVARGLEGAVERRRKGEFLASSYSSSSSYLSLPIKS